ncbi:unnamed protein product, partial [Ectocarpus sp. 6 AP-2014]
LREGNNSTVDTNTKYSIETYGTFQVHSLPNGIYLHTCARARTLLLLLLRYLGLRRENNGQPAVVAAVLCLDSTTPSARRAPHNVGDLYYSWRQQQRKLLTTTKRLAFSFGTKPLKSERVAENSRNTAKYATDSKEATRRSNDKPPHPSTQARKTPCGRRRGRAPEVTSRPPSDGP